ncbi:hypothetical protein HALLA_07480 [Halostagnicola larsenii XH-48]|uniref:DUF3006 domain-containing protein n=1 Tax=Halostagnicola larsenii XH-48 TaxID=797299 RepID=W0JNH1_9EURY|nr:DUF3006 domain-containing protein [Halostagnicola larsenii]AHF98719.1 hypothetical protein HALLA_07480 [Halostagnicola larsenii XH-48]
MSATYTAVLDRIVDGETAVLLLEEDESVREERTVPVADLPEAGRHEGAVFELEVTEDSILEATYRPDAERERRERMQDRFDDLSERLSDE